MPRKPMPLSRRRRRPRSSRCSSPHSRRSDCRRNHIRRTHRLSQNTGHTELRQARSNPSYQQLASTGPLPQQNLPIRMSAPVPTDARTRDIDQVTGVCSDLVDFYQGNPRRSTRAGHPRGVVSRRKSEQKGRIGAARRQRKRADSQTPPRLDCRGIVPTRVTGDHFAGTVVDGEDGLGQSSRDIELGKRGTDSADQELFRGARVT